MTGRRRHIESRLAVALTPGVNADVARRMAEAGIEPEDYVSLPIDELNERIGISPVCRIQDMHRQEAIARARGEYEFMEAHSIEALYLDDETYPWRLAEVHDAPVLLYKLGRLDLNSVEGVAVVGTRRCTSYGVSSTESIVRGLGERFERLAIVSGLAYGIDAVAHRESMRANMPTVAVVAHGLDTIYPAQHRRLAADIIREGGCILSEYPRGSRAFRRCFLERNRIVAGMSGAVLVMESEIKGGAMSTAGQAFGYDREVFALPGRITDSSSNGCNHLISCDKARILIDAVQIGSVMGWRMLGVDTSKVERNLFPELEGDNRKIYDTLRVRGGTAGIDDLHLQTGLPVATLMSLLSELEFDGIVMRLPGNKYTLT